MLSSSGASFDLAQSFLIDHSHIRGRLVRLDEVVNTILTGHGYPQAVSYALAEMLVVVAMLSGNLKSEGVLTLQASGKGAVKFLVVDATHAGHLRGYAEITEEGYAALEGIDHEKATLKDILGEGYLAITLDHGGESGRYQGIVELTGQTVAEALRGYFTQSQQVDMAVKLAVEKKPRKQEEGWRAAGIMIEQVPQEGGVVEEKTPVGEVDPDAEEQWNRTRIFMESVTDAELLERTLPTWSVLERLFNEEGVWAYPPKGLHAVCRCSREHVADVLSMIPQPDLDDMKVDGLISVNCRFCNKTEEFDEEAIAAIYGG